MTPDRSVESELRTLESRAESGRPVWEWFDRRLRGSGEVRRSLPYHRLNPEEGRRALAGLWAQGDAGRPRALYVHVPFCRQSCLFCGYRRDLANGGEAMDRFVDRVSSDLGAIAASPWGRAAPFSAVYFGGGTPTALSPASLLRLVETVTTAVSLDQDAEITIETTASDYKRHDWDRLRAAGVNRVSFGLQTLDPLVRRRIGRALAPDEALEIVPPAGRAGIDRIAADLIYNLPGQTLPTWRNDLDVVLDSSLDGLDVYPLIPHPNAPLTEAVQKGEIQIGAIDHEYACHQAAQAAVDQRPEWSWSTPVHLSRSGGDTAQYITARAKNWDVLALSGGSVGSIGPVTYLNMGPEGDLSAVFHLDAAVARNDLSHLELAEIGRAPADRIDGRPGLEEAVGALIRTGLARRADDHVELSVDGRFWAGNIADLMIRYRYGR